MHKPPHSGNKKKPGATHTRTNPQILFGDQRIESALDKRPDGSAQAFPFQDHIAGVAASVGVYVAWHNHATALTVGLYTNKAGHPQSRIASGSQRSPKPRAWNTVTVNSAAIHAGQTYWLVVLGKGGTLYFRDRRPGTCKSEQSFRTRLTSLPRSWRAGRHSKRCPISAYVIGTPARRSVASVAPVNPPPLHPPPVNTLAPQISGVTLVGDTLTASVGSWSNIPSGYSYQWQQCSPGGNECSNISGATGTAYTATPGDVDSTLDVIVTATNSAGSESASSLATGLVGPPGVRVFYISYSSGSDRNTGTSKTAPWQHSPGMNGCTANCASYLPVAGDRFLFEGGDTWPNGAFPLATGGGTPGKPDYYGVETDWYSGGSWTQPTFSGGGSNITGTDPNGSGGAQDVIMDLRSHDFIEVDDIHFANFTASGLASPYGTCAAIEMVGDHNITINRVSVPNMAVDSTSWSGPDCYGVLAATYSPYSGNSIVENSSFSGAANSYATAILCLGNVENNTVNRMIGEIYPCGHGTISGNLLENCGNPFPAGSSGIHADAIQTDNSDGTYYIHDNVIHDTGADQSAPNECESMLIGNPNETDYVWNNVLYSIHGNAISLTQDSAPGVAAYIWNNSIAGGQDGSAYCFRSGHRSTWTTITIQNNLCISNAGAVDPALAATTLTTNHQVTLSTSTASKDGYTSTETHIFSPDESFAPSVVAGGTNLTTNCSGSLSALCSDSTYAGTRTPLSRPTGATSWDIGAYMR